MKMTVKKKRPKVSPDRLEIIRLKKRLELQKAELLATRSRAQNTEQRLCEMRDGVESLEQKITAAKTNTDEILAEFQLVLNDAEHQAWGRIEAEFALQGAVALIAELTYERNALDHINEILRSKLNELNH